MADLDCTATAHRDLSPTKLTPLDLARFWSKVKVGHYSECWEWQGAKQGFGHGVWKVGSASFVTSRLAYSLLVGDIPDGQIIRHTCDNPLCCNPSHLLTGTHSDNVADRVVRGRSAVGERNGRAILTAEEVLKIYTDPRRSKAIAEDYGVNASTVRYIKTGRIWKSVTKRVGVADGA